MIKELVVRLNEIGQEIGFPYQILKNGEYQPFNAEDGEGVQVAIVVYEPLPEDCMLSELRVVNGDSKLEFNQLFPCYKEEKGVKLSLLEELKFIMFGKTEAILDYYKGKQISKRVAKAMVARNDFDLLLAMRQDDGALLPVLTDAIVSFMSNQKFEEFMKRASEEKVCRFSAMEEEKIVLEADDEKFSSYVKYYGLFAPAQTVIVRKRLFDKLNQFVALGGRFAHDIVMALEYINEYSVVRVAYKNALEKYVGK